MEEKKHDNFSVRCALLRSLARSKESRRGRRYDESAVVGCQESSHHQSSSGSVSMGFMGSMEPINLEGWVLKLISFWK